MQLSDAEPSRRTMEGPGLYGCGLGVALTPEDRPHAIERDVPLLQTVQERSHHVMRAGGVALTPVDRPHAIEHDEPILRTATERIWNGYRTDKDGYRALEERPKDGRLQRGRCVWRRLIERHPEQRRIPGWLAEAANRHRWIRSHVSGPQMWWHRISGPPVSQHRSSGPRKHWPRASEPRKHWRRASRP